MATKTTNNLIFPTGMPKQEVNQGPLKPVYPNLAKPSALSGNQNIASPMGVKATSPQTNAATPQNTIAPSMTASVTPPKAPTTATQGNSSNTATAANTGMIGGPNSLFGSNVSKLSNYNLNQDPGIQDALARQREFEGNYADTQSNIAGRPNPFGYATSLSDMAASRHAQLSPVYQSQVSQAYQGAGQNLSALSSATSAAQPQQVSPGNFYTSPVTGQDVSGGNINPFSGGVRTAQVAQGGQYQNNLPILSAAKSIGSNLASTITSSGLNSEQLNAANWLKQVYASNTSDPRLQQIQSAFNNVISQYARVLGVDPNALISNLTSTAQGTSINTLLSNLDQQATTYNNSLLQAGTGQAPAPSTGGLNMPPSPPPTQPQSFTRPNGQVVHLQANGTYQ